MYISKNSIYDNYKQVITLITGLMLSADFCHQIPFALYYYIKQSVNIIIRLMGSDMVLPKVILSSSTYLPHSNLVISWPLPFGGNRNHPICFINFCDLFLFQKCNLPLLLPSFFGQSEVQRAQDQSRQSRQVRQARQGRQVRQARQARWPTTT
jgi:hypothetical protein